MGTSQADDNGRKMYQIAITNLTHAQIVSAFVVATHRTPFSPFDFAEPATPELTVPAQSAAE